MMDALRFIFSSFWIWLGFTTLVAVVLKYLVDAIKAIRNTRNVKICTFENGNRTVEIENATKADVADAIGTSSGQFE
jgi:hypothetical protein